MKSTIILKIKNLMLQKPRPVTIGLGMAITFSIGAALGILDSLGK
jgi:hypothetical protein